MAVALSGTSGQYLRRSANISAVFTIMAWAKRASSQNGSYRTLCSAEDNVTTSSAFNFIQWKSDNSFVLRDGSSNPAFASEPAVGDPFCFAMTRSGSGPGNLKGYWRAATSNVWVTQSAGDFSSDPTGAYYIGNDSYGDVFDGAFWNVKIWDRVLTADELMVESFYRRPMFPASLNCWWPLDNLSDANDYGGNARAPTIGGTLANADGSHGLWRARRRIIAPATTSTARTVNAATESLVLTAQQARVNRARGVNAVTESLVLTAQQARVNRARGVNAATESLVLTAQQAQVNKGGARVVQASTALLVLSTQQAEVIRGAAPAQLLHGIRLNIVRPTHAAREARAALDALERIEEQTPRVARAPKVAAAKARVIAIARDERAEISQKRLDAALDGLEQAIADALLAILSSVGKRR